jgi:hypothetical protein
MKTKAANGTRSILRRPAALPMSPLAFQAPAATFSVFANSPHVHFPASPAMAATFATYSPSSYDRGNGGPVVPVSPLFSPSLRGFKLAAPPRPFRSLTYQASPAIEDFEDPRSPKVQRAATGRARVRFASFSTADQVLASKRNPMSIYPRSPYPTAPLETTEANAAREAAKENAVPPAPAALLLEPRKRNKKGLSLASRRNSGFPSISSPLTQSFTAMGNFTPISSINRANKPAPLDLTDTTPESERLSNDFWNAVSMEPDSAGSQPMHTALEYPQSAVNYEALQENELRSATAPQIIYAGSDGVPLWSPSVPKPGAKANKIRESLMSPARPQLFRNVARREITAPSPNDPFAAFPSFAAVVLDQQNIQYPPAVLSRG